MWASRRLPGAVSYSRGREHGSTTLINSSGFELAIPAQYGGSAVASFGQMRNSKDYFPKAS
jgi:hypothetical protein